MTIFFLLFFAFIIFRFRKFQLDGYNKYISVTVFLLKCFTGIVVLHFYTKHYGGGDMSVYLADAEILYRNLLENPKHTFQFVLGISAEPVSGLHMWNDSGFTPFYNDARTVLVVNTLIRFFSFGIPAVHLIIMNVLCWIGMILMFKTLNRYHLNSWINLLPFLLPQTLIWTGSVLKEPLLILQMGVLIYTLDNFRLSGTVSWICLLLVSFSFAIMKPVIGILILPAVVAWLICKYKSDLKPVLVYTVVCLIAITIVLLPELIPGAKGLPEILFGHQLAMYRFAVYNHAGSVIMPVGFAPTAWSFIKHIPEAFLYGLIQPLPWIYKGWWVWPVVAENVATVFLLLVMIRKSYRQIASHPLRLFLLLSGLSVITIMAFVTPVAGTLIRYRMPGVLLMLLAFCVKKNDQNVINESNAHQKFL